MERPSEADQYHAHILKCSLAVEHSRAYWKHVTTAVGDNTEITAFTEYWFGAKSLPRVRLFLWTFRDRFDRFPPSTSILHRWKSIDTTTRRLICHWHLQLTDRLYREFTGEYLVDRVGAGRVDVTRDVVVQWLEKRAPQRWTVSTRTQFAKMLLHSAAEAGILKGNRDPRQFQIMRVSDESLGYILYLLRTIQFNGTLVNNPYLASVGITAKDLERRLLAFPSCGFRRQGDLLEFTWRYNGLNEWAEETVLKMDSQLRGTA